MMDTRYRINVHSMKDDRVAFHAEPVGAVDQVAEVARLIRLLRRKFPSRYGYRLSLSIETSERAFYKSADEYMRKMCGGDE
jgi:hypothetical protein